MLGLITCGALESGLCWYGVVIRRIQARRTWLRIVFSLITNPTSDSVLLYKTVVRFATLLLAISLNLGHSAESTSTCSIVQLAGMTLQTQGSLAFKRQARMDAEVRWLPNCTHHQICRV